MMLLEMWGPILVIGGGSFLFWQIVRAIFYRLTGDDDRPFVFGVLYLVFVVAVGFGLSFLDDAMHSYVLPNFGGDWLPWSIQICEIVIILMLGILMLWGILAAFARMVGAIRGG